MVSFEIFVKSMPPSLSELKVLPSFCFAFKIPDDMTVTTSDNNKTWEKNEFKKFVIFLLMGIVSSFSAQKLKCPSSARLEPENSSSGSSLKITVRLGS